MKGKYENMKKATFTIETVRTTVELCSFKAAEIILIYPRLFVKENNTVEQLHIIFGGATYAFFICVSL